MSRFEIFNAVSMIFPLFAWWKHRRSKSKMAKVVKYHCPLSFTYHLVKAFHPVSRVTKVLLAIDQGCIHLCSMLAKRDLSKPPHTLSVPFHIITYVYSILIKDVPYARFSLIVLDNFKYIRQNNEIIVQGSIAFICFISSYNTNMQIGHSIFHVLMYKIYDNFFIIIEKRR